MKYREIEHAFPIKGKKGRFEQFLIASVLTPSVVSLVDIGPMDFRTRNGKLFPLNTRMKNVENMVEYFERRTLRFRSLFRMTEKRLDVSIEIMLRNTNGKFLF